MLDFAQRYYLLLSFIRRKRDKSLLDGQAVAKGFKDFEWMRKDPDLQSTREDPRFKALGGSQNGSREEWLGWHFALCKRGPGERFSLTHLVVREKDRTVCRRIVEESLDIDLAYGTNLAPSILCKEEYEQNKDYRTPFYNNLERESLPL